MGEDVHYLVYKVTNQVNGKIYIGVHKTRNIDDGYMGSGRILRRAISKYGIENFVKEILFEASTAEEMFSKERELVEVSEHTYNIKKGGEGGFDYINGILYINGRSDNWKKNMSIAQRGKHVGKYNANYGKHPSEETRRKLRQAKKGNKHFQGRKHTDETKSKMSSSKKGKCIGLNGRCWITKDRISKQVKKEDIDIYTAIGWLKGRVMPQKLLPEGRKVIMWVNAELSSGSSQAFEA